MRLRVPRTVPWRMGVLAVLAASSGWTECGATGPSQQVRVLRPEAHGEAVLELAGCFDGEDLSGCEVAVGGAFAGALWARCGRRIFQVVDRGEAVGRGSIEVMAASDEGRLVPLGARSALWVEPERVWMLEEQGVRRVTPPRGAGAFRWACGAPGEPEDGLLGTEEGLYLRTRSGWRLAPWSGADGASPAARPLRTYGGCRDREGGTWFFEGASLYWIRSDPTEPWRQVGFDGWVAEPQEAAAAFLGGVAVRAGPYLYVRSAMEAPWSVLQLPGGPVRSLVSSGGALWARTEARWWVVWSLEPLRAAPVRWEGAPDTVPGGEEDARLLVFEGGAWTLQEGRACLWRHAGGPGAIRLSGLRPLQRVGPEARELRLHAPGGARWEILSNGRLLAEGDVERGPLRLPEHAAFGWHELRLRRGEEVLASVPYRVVRRTLASWEGDVRAIAEGYCAVSGCHDGAGPLVELRTLEQWSERVEAIRARLAGSGGAPMPPLDSEPRRRWSDDLARTVIEWIDAGLPRQPSEAP